MLNRLKLLLLGIKRISFDLLGLAIVIGIFFLYLPEVYFPPEAKVAFVSLVLTKLILVSCGIVHFQITRKLLFPYIDFRKEKDWSNNAVIIAMLVVIIWAWARGG